MQPFRTVAVVEYLLLIDCLQFSQWVLAAKLGPKVQFKSNAVNFRRTRINKGSRRGVHRQGVNAIFHGVGRNSAGDELCSNSAFSLFCSGLF
jgi:hypothetical protein